MPQEKLLHVVVRGRYTFLLLLLLCVSSVKTGARALAPNPSISNSAQASVVKVQIIQLKRSRLNDLPFESRAPG